MRNRSQRIKQNKFVNRLLIIVSIIFVLFLVYILFFSSIFHIKQVFIYNLENTNKDKFKNEIILSLRNYNNSFLEEMFFKNLNFPNILFFNPTSFKKDILFNFPNISNIKIKKNIYFKELKIILNERDPVLQIQDDFSLVCVDSFGYVFNNCSPKPQLPKIYMDKIKTNIFYFKQNEIDIFKNLLKENPNLNIVYSKATPKSFKISQFDDKIDILLPLNDKAVLAYRAAVQYYVVKQPNMSVLDARYYPEKFYYK